MKQLNGILVVLFGALLIGCNSNPTNEGNISSDIIGNWQWKSTTGGIGGTTTTPTGDNVYVLRITSDSNYIELRNDTTTFTDKFTTYQFNISDSSQSHLVIDFINSRRFSLLVIKVTTDSLILSDMITDGFTSVYTRMNY